ncbi:hypothetical protein [Bowmanella dokdonensis]|uniref:Uncharacterized protein n=1 Tax=Bowmanella dokdonensis TaxID=751969 RepID=A0A939DLB0_9ALTE|nr:hypothetical protein [Bowmanella dokdonensis]MBN7824260.1 hypothetical protein [Bowmanella dokdonensis]
MLPSSTFPTSYPSSDATIHRDKIVDELGISRIKEQELLRELQSLIL